jgi:hypothetical protein
MKKDSVLQLRVPIDYPKCVDEMTWEGKRLYLERWAASRNIHLDWDWYREHGILFAVDDDLIERGFG